MDYRFTKSFDDLKSALLKLQGEWKSLNPNHKQFRSIKGPVLNWFPSTGTLQFQGKTPEIEVFQSQVLQALNYEYTETKENPSIPPEAYTKPKSENISRTENNITNEDILSDSFLISQYSDSELILALIGAVGTQLNKAIDVLEEKLKQHGYTVLRIKVTSDILPNIVNIENFPPNDEYKRIKSLMDSGDKARKESKDNSILSLGVAAYINLKRPKGDKSKIAYIISSLKHPEEVIRLRQIYPLGFYLIGVHCDEKRRYEYLTDDKRMSHEQAEELIKRDENDREKHGQHLSNAFHLSDFFIRIDGQDDQLKYSIWRIVDLLFSHPYTTPTFDEYAMFMAFSSTLRSADLSRQVGAVVSKNNEIVSTGANDCPKFGGGLYWPEYNGSTHKIEDQEDGRDFMRGEDSNKVEQQRIIDEIIGIGKKEGLNEQVLANVLWKSRIKDITEYGRVVHAEMEAMLACARVGISTKGCTLYSTTFPCHNCAKHIVAAGIERVVFIEPYPKSKAIQFHSDSIFCGFVPDNDNQNLVHFEPFIGVGPRRFFDLFSMKFGSGNPLLRKDESGHIISYDLQSSPLRLQMLPVSYRELEKIASKLFNESCQIKE